MVNLEPVGLFDSSEGCAGFFGSRAPNRFTQTEISPQYLEMIFREAHQEAELELMLAVLEDAVTCFQKHFAARDRIGTRLFREAEKWILLKEKSDWSFSFDNICETLDLDPGYIREGLLRWRSHRCRERHRIRSRVDKKRYASKEGLKWTLGQEKH